MEEKLDNATIPNQYTLCLDRQCPKASTCLRQLADHQPETPRLIEGNLPLLPSEQESTLCRRIRKPIGELAAQTDALRYPGTHEALQPAYLLPCPQGRKAAFTLRATGRIECA